MIIDAHVRIGQCREAALTVPDLLTSMDRLGIDRCLVAPDERATAVDNRRGNDLTTQAAMISEGRLIAYAVANPWFGDAAVDELRRARDNGARALAVDPVLQGFDLLDGLLDPLLRFAADAGWPVYVRTGTPPTALPLPLALLCGRYPEVSFLMGRSGATDFWIDAVPALLRAPNLFADTCYAPWDTVLTDFGSHPDIGPARVFFSTDSPYTVPAAELKRVIDWPLSDCERAAVMGGVIQGLL
ncbi:amidohydrolase family protein [Nonomuraea basaltis]|uniref:amidohydrolase family protein n=1 Tax=Nonomuraea basaltis TaxID=2495887 RepID=UPI00110C63C5|nr:amidohydrolase family protein [Nonomuraea basaltis]TMR96559.1 amidohydrolase [Nonomuraea basaltis]